MEDFWDAIYSSLNLFTFVENAPMFLYDYRGLLCEDRCIEGSIGVSYELEFSTSIRGVSPELKRKNLELLKALSLSSAIMVGVTYLPIKGTTMLVTALSDSALTYFQTPGFDDALGDLLGVINQLEEKSNIILRAFATYEYKICVEKCCLFYKKYNDWEVKTSKQMEVMRTLNPTSKSEEEYEFLLQNAIERSLNKWLEGVR